MSAAGAAAGVVLDPPAVNVWGLIVLGASLLTVGLLLLYFAIRKWQSATGRMNSVAAGQLRLAASRGRVSDLELIATLPGFRVDADLAGWTSLHAAAAQGHPGALQRQQLCRLAPACQPPRQPACVLRMQQEQQRRSPRADPAAASCPPMAPSIFVRYAVVKRPGRPPSPCAR